MITNNYQDILGKYPMALLMRHGERYSIRDGDSGYNTGLTVKGKISSYMIGKDFLNGKISDVYSSPLIRCTSTAKYLLSGAKQETIQIKYSNILGEPGCYVLEKDKCGGVFSKLGTRQTVFNYIDKGQMDGFRNIREGSELLKDYILSFVKDTCLVSIFISHDAIIMPFISCYLNYSFNENNWIDYLEGPIIFIKNNESYIRFRNDTKILGGI